VTAKPPTPLFAVSSACRELGLRVGAILFRNVEIGPASTDLRTKIDVEVDRVRQQFPEMAHAKATPELQRIDSVFRQCGVKPRKHSSSVHRLYHGVIKRKGFPCVNNLVDAYNLISLQSRCTLGSHDIDQFAAPCTLRLIQGDETFVPLGKNQNEQPVPGEFAYIDSAKRVMCRLNVLQADFSKVTDTTRNAMVIVEGSTAHDQTELPGIFQRCLELVEQSCGGKGEIIALPD